MHTVHHGIDSVEQRHNVISVSYDSRYELYDTVHDSIDWRYESYDTVRFYNINI
jgi:hypothetical protein